MNEPIVSKDKLSRLKNALFHYQHHFELKSLNESNLDNIPMSYTYFSKNNRSGESFTYFNTYYVTLLSLGEEESVNEIIINSLTCLTDIDLSNIKRVISTQDNLWNRLLDKSHATYTIDFNRKIDKKFSQTLLSIYASSYENTEILLVLYWICQSLVGQTLITNFENYKDRFGNILKGKLTKGIIELIGNQPAFEAFKQVIEEAYYSQLRHLPSHNSAKLDEDNEMIISIDQPDIKISYEKAYQSLYSLQQLQNHAKMLLNNLFIDKDKIINEGVTGVLFAFTNEGDESLFLIQLEPFFNNDIANSKEVNTISVILKDGHYIFSCEKELVCIPSNEKLDNWYQKEPKNNQIVITSARPNIYQEDDTFITLDTEYGNYIILDHYYVNKVNYS